MFADLTQRPIAVSRVLITCPVEMLDIRHYLVPVFKSQLPAVETHRIATPHLKFNLLARQVDIHFVAFDWAARSLLPPINLTPDLCQQRWFAQAAMGYAYLAGMQSFMPNECA